MLRSITKALTASLKGHDDPGGSHRRDRQLSHNSGVLDKQPRQQATPQECRDKPGATRLSTTHQDPPSKPTYDQSDAQVELLSSTPSSAVQSTSLSSCIRRSDTDSPFDPLDHSPHPGIGLAQKDPDPGWKQSINEPGRNRRQLNLGSALPRTQQSCLVNLREVPRPGYILPIAEVPLTPRNRRVSARTTLSRKTSNDNKTAMPRKVWVRRPGASATRVEVHEDDLVDNVRDVILQKYANSLGKSIDSPDITLKILSREQANKNIASERILSPEESIGKTLDAYYPGGQTIEEALVIDVPQRRTPKPSPRPGNHLSYYVSEDFRPGDGARDYFPPMPAVQSPRLSHVQHPTIPNGPHPVHSMAVLTTGQIPLLPSPGGHATRRHARPKYGRQHTSSPTILHTSQPNIAETKVQLNGPAPPAPPLPTPPAQADHKTNITPPNRTTSPHPNRLKKRKTTQNNRDPNADPPLPSKPASAALLDGRVPPINVLIVEDNVINLRLLEQFMRRLKVRWKTAMNGKEAVSVWREGGFHLVLMDIQLPVMNGLEATKEIRRLESVNGIGLSVFDGAHTNGDQNGACATNGEVQSEDKLEDRTLFKSPVIIVALTASSLQSDRHEALAVGCNDFLTKPVNFGWMERKVTEWGCMQALIDFDGWRKWKEIEAKKDSMDPEKRKQEEKEEKAKAKAALKAMLSRPPPTPSSTNKDEASDGRKPEKEKEKSNSASSGDVTSPTSAEHGHNKTNGIGTPGRRNFRGSRNGGSIGSLPTTREVEESNK